MPAVLTGMRHRLRHSTDDLVNKALIIDCWLLAAESRMMSKGRNGSAGRPPVGNKGRVLFGAQVLS